MSVELEQNTVVTEISILRGVTRFRNHAPWFELGLELNLRTKGFPSWPRPPVKQYLDYLSWIFLSFEFAIVLSSIACLTQSWTLILLIDRFEEPMWGEEKIAGKVTVE